MHWHVAIAAIVTGGFAVVVTVASHSPISIGPGPGPTCALPPRTCNTGCADLLEMPLEGPGYVDDREEIESIPATSTSYLRRDLMMLVQYAAAKVACKADGWNTGHGGPIMLGDMSERDGSIPGTLWGRPRHPRNSHVDGRSIDIAYYQRGTPNNKQRAICTHQLRGKEMWSCLAPPDRLDAWRTALFIGAFLEEPGIRVIGVDGKVAPPLLDAFDELCATGWIEPVACASRRRIVYETRPGGRGWFYGHHNHLHVAWGGP